MAVHEAVVKALQVTRQTIEILDVSKWVSVQVTNVGFRVEVSGGLIAKKEAYDHETFRIIAEEIEKSLGDNVDWAYAANSFAGRIFVNHSGN